MTGISTITGAPRSAQSLAREVHNKVKMDHPEPHQRRCVTRRSPPGAGAGSKIGLIQGYLPPMAEPRGCPATMNHRGDHRKPHPKSHQQVTIRMGSPARLLRASIGYGSKPPDCAHLGRWRQAAHRVARCQRPRARSLASPERNVATSKMSSHSCGDHPGAL